MKINSIVLSLGAIVLLMGSCDSKEEVNNVVPLQVEEDKLTPEDGKKAMVIAIVNSDTLLSQYDYALFLRDELTEQSLKYEGVLRQKESKLRADMEKLQRDAPSLSQFEGQRRQKDLYEDQDKLQLKQEEYGRKLMTIEQGYNRDIDQAINEYLDRYCADKPFEMVLSNSDLGIIRWAADGLDITNDVLTGLNEEYRAKMLDTAPETK